MESLARELRRELERAVTEARRTAELGARKALEQLAVHHHEPWPSMTPAERELRRRLRAHGRMLGDGPGAKPGTQSVERLTGECAYEHWHRMLFARFLAECDLLLEPETGMPLSLAECRELAGERKVDWLALASEFAERMLPQIFRTGDPVLEVRLAPETRHELEETLSSLPAKIFEADDSLGWVYQFWQAERKARVNESGVKIGADELPAVTQLFTEDYMVLFLLHNTLGAWWTAKRQQEGKSAALPDHEWTYLWVDEAGAPAAGGFDGWPRTARELRVLDPCMGSGHFLVFALPILVGFRMEEEGLTREQAVAAVLQDNLFGLEIDPRCTQIAAFNLAFAAWKMAGYRPLPAMNLACSGLSVNAKEQEWLDLAGGDERLRGAMSQLYRLFQQGPILGSLIDPKRVGGDLFAANFSEVRPLLERALAAESDDEGRRELAVAARGIAEAARILAGEFTLVATNVPYAGRGKQVDGLRAYCQEAHPDAKADLGTCVMERCVDLCSLAGSAALVMPQGWHSLSSYRDLRKRLLTGLSWNFVARLGSKAFQTPMWEFNILLLGFSRNMPATSHRFAGLDAAEFKSVAEKAVALRARPPAIVLQANQLLNPDSLITLDSSASTSQLSHYAKGLAGILNGDTSRFEACFWEVEPDGRCWEFHQSTVGTTMPYGGREKVILWEKGEGRLRQFASEVRERLHDADRRGNEAWLGKGVAVSEMGALPATLYTGEKFDSNIAVVLPATQTDIAALWSFCSSDDFPKAVRRLSQRLNVTNATLVKVPFDLAHWQQVAAEKYPDGLPKPHSDDPTQWLFCGHPLGSEQPLQVAVARLLGYRWPRQTGSSFTDCPALGPDGLEPFADPDGIVCLPSVMGEQPADRRLDELLAAAFGPDWSAARRAELLSGVGYEGRSLDDWLRDDFFQQHCELFHQRPFVWHVWDGRKDGFHALVNYHKLAAPGEEGRRTLEKLIYSYLGDWLIRQRDEQQAHIEGADARLGAAEHLKSELEKILRGEQPYDLFVRWKPLHEQPLGWEPDLDDGVRLNLRPFVTARPLGARSRGASILRVTPKVQWGKDRGKEPERPRADYPWFWTWDEKTADFEGSRSFDGNRWNDLHYSLSVKQAARARQAAKR